MGWNDYMEQIVMLAKLIKIGHKYDVSLMSQYYFNVKMMFSSLSLTGWCISWVVQLMALSRSPDIIHAT